MSSYLLKTKYDRDSDVLYIVARQEPATKGVEDRHGIVWRYSKSGDLIGATIVDYHGLWEGKHDQLADELSERFHISSRDAMHPCDPEVAMISLAEAIKSGRLQEFIAQEEARGVGPAAQATLDRALSKIIKSQQSEGQTSRSASRGGSTGK